MKNIGICIMVGETKWILACSRANGESNKYLMYFMVLLAVKSTYKTSPILDFFGNLLQLQDKSGWSDSQRGRLDHDDAGTSVLLGYATGIEGFVVRCHWNSVLGNENYKPISGCNKISKKAWSLALNGNGLPNIEEKIPSSGYWC